MPTGMSGNQNLAKSVFVTLGPSCVMKSCVMTPSLTVQILKFRLESAAQYVHHLQVLPPVVVVRVEDQKEKRVTEELMAFLAETVRMAILVYLVLLAPLECVKTVLPVVVGPTSLNMTPNLDMISNLAVELQWAVFLDLLDLPALLDQVALLDSLDLMVIKDPLVNLDNLAHLDHQVQQDLQALWVQQEKMVTQADQADLENVEWLALLATEDHLACLVSQE